MEQALIKFYYYFHKHQHYFLCHDILEEAWKMNASFSKKDAIVSLILFSTAMYHFRRHNFKGALKSFQKALLTFQQASDKANIGLKEKDYINLIEKQIDNLTNHRPFNPVYLPVTECMEKLISNAYLDYEFNPLPVREDYIVHHHLLRDRREVVEARQQALLNKRRKRDETEI
ncbi:DUF309 domain-containing protein [Staphylococcus devriesei]|uniref:DUF309 domain-containing protein n=1 Tax=Staphylococcus devriesei TaxID=586733 RepID=A0A2K4DJV0_9STAP|nr:DUF309 domain-containing protein [Staphylococcus devriesei]MCE5089736.1 DUF309 domain-containing protein [Staphylococcus devriesei]MCE5097419.1 DUF309 domain-containing protein [Staphylococcus devriesei]PNZ87099.1 DUF309 domain-containing protein [Staphylococcus devriesei]PTE73944.1 DUF309 domain-containing protein [Staphylococcus devriesei]PTF03365.1 DUF309 domain-containing protein [Staphylococcus devriesei]